MHPHKILEPIHCRISLYKASIWPRIPQHSLNYFIELIIIFMVCQGGSCPPFLSARAPVCVFWLLLLSWKLCDQEMLSSDCCWVKQILISTKHSVAKGILLTFLRLTRPGPSPTNPSDREHHLTQAIVQRIKRTISHLRATYAKRLPDSLRATRNHWQLLLLFWVARFWGRPGCSFASGSSRRPFNRTKAKPSVPKSFIVCF